MTHPHKNNSTNKTDGENDPLDKIGISIKKVGEDVEIGMDKVE